MTKDTTNTKIAVISTDIKYIKEMVAQIQNEMSAQYVTRVEFEPIKKLVYGVVGLILTSVIGGLLALVVL